MNARRAQQSLNESASRGRRRKVDAFKSHRLEDVAVATLLRNQQQRINEAAKQEELQNGPEARYDARKDAVNKVRDMYKDMRAHVAPTDRGFCLADDGWSGPETAKFVAALQEAAELYGVTEEHILNMCAAYTYFDDVAEGRSDPHLTEVETYDLCHKVSAMLNVSFRHAYDYLAEYSKAGLAKKNGSLNEDIWSDPDFCREFVELHERSKEGHYWVDGELYFISEQRGIHEACGPEETAAYVENERRMRLASIMNGSGFSR